ncbi:pyridoxal-phosphate-dependent aminotransferase family protein [Thermoactinomyces mirandus]|uniref:Alanine--glyoxylate aminotransferase family protein n=1 Tax=Thermoactinomyces mirandus TaxID=2756294 RepID=A0A7W1XV31_9BACL|nr:alanine--glyoxylate aminotransferase family protein [Thermoactinomyces mirandus]MBA4603834.1 alanine--glyoxylate aminotransferase family protein [Thermoactinomyces mirandus]
MVFQDKFHLRIPGPTPVPPRVQQAMAKPMIGHRSNIASKLIQDCTNQLKPIFGTSLQPVILAGSGTSALEAAVVNTLSEGDEAIVVSTGAFGDRFAKIIQKYGFNLHVLDIPWGKACEPDNLSVFIQKYPQAKAVFLTYCETSTGVLNPIPELAQTVHQHSDALVVVDGVSCIGAVPCQMDEWNIDIMVTGSQKALMLPPGLAIVAASERAWKTIESNDQPSFYLDLDSYRKKLEQQATTPFTPAVSLLYGLKEALSMIEEEGYEQVFARHERLRKLTRAGIRALGLTLMVENRHASPTVTSIVTSHEKWDVESFRKNMQANGFIVAGGQQHLKGEIFRIGHMGYCDDWDIVAVLAAIEFTLHQMGVPVELGAATKAAQEVMLDV